MNLEVMKLSDIIQVIRGGIYEKRTTGEWEVKNDIGDAEIAIAIVKFFRNTRISTWVLAIGIINTITLFVVTYLFIFFDFEFSSEGKGFALFFMALIPLVAGAILRVEGK